MEPSFTEFSKSAGEGNLVPVYKEFLADMETPVSAYSKIGDKAYSYLLESADGGSRWGRYSFIGYKPLVILKSRDREVELFEGEKRELFREVDNPLHVLRSLIRRFRPASVKGLPPFQGGLVGYVDYELVRKWEPFPGLFSPETERPESIFVHARRLIVFDHLTHRIKVVAFARVRQGDDLEEVYFSACKEIEETIHELKSPTPSMSSSERGFSLSSLEGEWGKAGFEEAVWRVKNYIERGDAIQVVLSQRFSGAVEGDDFILYRQLRSINPSPYLFYLNFGEVKLIGSSPEVLVRLTDGKVELRPIAGTRPRGKTDEQDLMLEEELKSDSKEQAEHIMLVDLGRNDVGKVAEAGSVAVPRLMEVERYSHVMHLVSSVEGRLKPGADALDVFMAAFPAGTVSGAPKIRAMEIISELEPSRRGPYAGAVGYFGFNGNMDFCITIRTIALSKGRLSLQAGAGIVADSVPEREYEETLNKAGAMLQAIRAASEQ